MSIPDCKREKYNSLQDRIQADLKAAIVNKDIALRESLKIIVSELQRQKRKELSDETVVEVLRKLESWECDRLEKSGQTGSDYLYIIKNYIPKQVSDEEIEKWITENIDLSKVKNKFAAIKPVLNHFGTTATSGSQVKNVLLNMDM